jgi:hypothetical protein
MMKNGMTFCGEDSRPAPFSCGAFGLMNEFMPSDQGTYESAVPGKGSFLKMGVGILLRTTEGPYSQKADYPVVRVPEVVERHSDSSYRSVLSQSDYYGYSYILEKEIRVRDYEMEYRYKLQNSGTKVLSFGEYVHNFYRLGTGSKAEDYRLSGNLKAMPEQKEVLLKSGHSFRLPPFQETCACRLMGWQLEEADSPFFLRLSNPANGLYVQETTEAPVVRSFLWALPDTVCPEMIVQMKALPGETVGWKRTYQFGQQKKAC